MKKLIKTISILVSLLFTICLVGCNTSLIKIAIIQLCTHGSLDSATNGIISGLEDAGYIDGKNVKIDIYNPEQDIVALATMVSEAVKDAKLIFANSTIVAQMTLNECKKQSVDTPIFFTSVTDPVTNGLISNPDAPEGQITGTSDMTCIEDQIKLLFELNPQAKSVGLLWNTSEDNSVVQINLAKDICKKYNLETFTQPVTNSTEFKMATERLIADGIDAIYLPSDNMIASNIKAVTNLTNQAGIPAICAVTDMVKDGGTITLGLDYFRLGIQTANQAIRYLRDNVKIIDIKVETFNDFDLVINKTVCDNFKIFVPKSLLERADILV